MRKCLIVGGSASLRDFFNWEKPYMHEFDEIYSTKPWPKMNDHFCYRVRQYAKNNLR